jgi:hypothetical protein
MSSFSIEKYFYKFKEHVTSLYVTSSFSIKNNSKNSRKSPHATSPFSIENNSKNSSSMPYHLSLLKTSYENSRSMSHHFMPRHISPLKNNSKN